MPKKSKKKTKLQKPNKEEKLIARCRKEGIPKQKSVELMKKALIKIYRAPAVFRDEKQKVKIPGRTGKPTDDDYYWIHDIVRLINDPHRPYIDIKRGCNKAWMILIKNRCPKTGFPQFRIGFEENSLYYIKDLMYAAFRGPIPNDMVVVHKKSCADRLDANPWNMKLIDSKDFKTYVQKHYESIERKNSELFN